MYMQKILKFVCFANGKSKHIIRCIPHYLKSHEGSSAAYSRRGSTRGFSILFNEEWVVLKSDAKLLLFCIMAKMKRKKH